MKRDLRTLVKSMQGWGHAIAREPIAHNLPWPLTKSATVDNRSYQLCTNCVMDTTDPAIVFDGDGVCDHCINFRNKIRPNWQPDGVGVQELNRILSRVRKSGQGKEYDCILGLSGGVDSSYMLHLAVTQFGLRPLVFHVDGGWNSELAVHNISVMVDKLGLDLFTEVIDWEEMRDFQLAFLKSGVPHIDLAQDHAFVATLYKYAEKHGVKYILNGGNISTEGVSNPKQYFYWGTDMVHIKDILRRFGTVNMATYPFSSIFNHKIYLYLKGVRRLQLLNYVKYDKAQSAILLQREYGWKPYPRKHFESRFTAFYEGYWLPRRFGFDTRRVQYSSLILTNQMTRDEALARLTKPEYDEDSIKSEFEYVATKLGITPEELTQYLTMPKKYYWDYKNIQYVFDVGARVYNRLGFEAQVWRR